MSAGLEFAEWRFNPAGMDTALKAGFVVSVKATQKVAMDLRPSKKMIPGVSIVQMDDHQATLKGRGLAAVFEGGRHAGADIYPSGVKGYRRSYSRKHGIGVVRYRGTSAKRAQTNALLVSSGPLGGRFFAHVTEGAMAPKPFLHPSAEAWAHGIYTTSVRAAMSSAGYGSLRSFGT